MQGRDRIQKLDIWKCFPAILVIVFYCCCTYYPLVRMAAYV